MKRLLLLGAVLTVAGLFPMAHSALAAPASKVNVCHLNSSNTPATYEYDYVNQYHYYSYDYSYEYHYTYTYSFGNVIEVAESALGGHEGHGDSTSYWTLTDYLIDYFGAWSQYNYTYSYSWDYRPAQDYYGSYAYSTVRTDSEIKNADCYVYSYTND